MISEVEFPENFDAPRAEAAIRELLIAVGEDPDREGLQDTPARVARAYAENFAGLHKDPTEVLERTFSEDHQELVLIKDIPIYSMCEHLCMGMRGIRKPGAMTTTSAVRGGFKRSAASRAEVLSLIRD